MAAVVELEVGEGVVAGAVVAGGGEGGDCLASLKKLEQPTKPIAPLRLTAAATRLHPDHE